MNGVLPSQNEKPFSINGFKFHVGVSGNEPEETMQISMVREKVAGGGNYSQSTTWQFVHTFDFSLYNAQMKDRMTREEVLSSAFEIFTEEANVKLAAFAGGGTTTPPTVPADLFQAVKWYIDNKLSFRSDTNQLVFA